MRVLTAVVVLGVLAVVYFALQQTPVNTPPVRTPVHSPSPAQSSAPAEATVPEPVESISPDEIASGATEPSTEERAATVKHMISEALGNTYRDKYVETLVAKGLAPADSANIVQDLIEGLTDCYFEATRLQYETHGVPLDDFVRGAHEVWNSTPPEYRYVSVENVASHAPECLADVSQQAGITIEVDANRLISITESDLGFDLWSQPNLLAQRDGAAIVSNDWSEQMEAKIFAHIAMYSNVALTDVRIKCEERGCVIQMQGPKIEIYQFEFRRFAEENGFLSAELGGPDYRRIVTLRK
jgi:hypothetical protein